MKRTIGLLAAVLLVTAACSGGKSVLCAAAARSPSKGAATFVKFRANEIRKFREFVFSLQKKKLSPQEGQKRVRDYARKKLVKAFLDFRKTEAGAKAAQEIDRELIVIAIQVAEDDTLVDRIVKSEKDVKKSLALKLFTAERYGEVENSRKAKELVDAVLRESKAKYPEVYKDAEQILFRVAPEGLAFPEFPDGTKDIDGKVLRVSDYRGKILLVDFWATWCGPCRTEIPSLVKVYQKYHDKGFEIVGISLDKSKGDLLKLTGKEKMTWRQYFDGLLWDNKVAKAYGIRAIPAMYLLGRDGNVISNNVRGGRLEEILAKELGGEK